jgi:DNA-binding transcriptional LysR family regulator
MEIRELTYFMAVAEDLSFTKAAVRLRMSQPPLSQAIAKLERKLGTRLFEREARTAPRLTPAGHVLMREAKRILQQIEQTESLLDSVVADVQPLRIGTISSVLAGLLPSVVRSFTAAHPEARVLVEESEEQAILSDLVRGSVDLGFTRVRGIDDRFEAQRLAVEPLMCALPDTHALAGDASVSLADLADDDFIMFNRDDAPQAYDRIVLACVRAGFSPRIPIHAVNDLSMLSTVACGLGVSIMPYLSSYLPIPGVRFVPIAEEWARTPLSMVWLAGRPNPMTQAFAAQVRAELVSRRDLALAEGRVAIEVDDGSTGPRAPRSA